MSAVQATRAPLQIEKLTDEELLQQFAETREELCATALWKRLADGKLKWIARSGCPPWYDQEWMIRGCYTRAFKRFCRHVRKFQGKLETPSFGAYLKSILVSSVRDERRFIKGTGHKIMVQFGLFDVVDDTGVIRRTDRQEEMDWMEALARARETDERVVVAGAEDEIESLEEGSEKPAEEIPDDPAMREALGELLHHIEPGPAPGPKTPGRQRRQYASRRALQLLGALAQPIPRPDAAVIRWERKYIVRILLLHHLTNEAKANSNDAIVRFFLREWTKASIAMLVYGEPRDRTERDRNEKRVRDTLVHDLISMRETLRDKFGVTSFSQV
ncbi:MAG TPA: hypothetical protein VE398_20260 [Acidobacteriota bacterium]|nr:hypothetical protein [Acidobacteriota bacterium]